MKKRCLCCRALWITVVFVSSIFLAHPVLGGITPSGIWKSEALPDPDPGVFTWNSSMGHYEDPRSHYLIYARDDGRIYAFDLITQASTEVCDTSALATAFSSVAGFLVTRNGYLYFHDNGLSSRAYRVLLTDPWPAAYEFFDTQCNGSIFSFTQNPWTDVVWFASADFGVGNMYLYEVNAKFDNATETASFAQPNGGGNGPIIFKGNTTVLYGESVWGGDGYFHLVDSSTGHITTPNYLTFSGGLAAAVYGYENVIYVTTGGGKSIYEIQDTTKTEVATTDEDAQGVVFDGFSFYISEQKSSDFSGAISFSELWRPVVPLGADGDGNPASISPGGGASGCFIGSVCPGLELNMAAAFLASLILGPLAVLCLASVLVIER